MSDVILDVSSIGKRYMRPVSLRPEYRKLKEHMEEVAMRLVGRRAKRKEYEAFWALHDVSFQLKRGEVLGIIGKNGSGKTTLLKIITRLTHPTTGSVSIRGSVGSYLGIGAGIHPELSGRENIAISGVLLGMTRQDIAKKEEEIIAFAELESFIDMPLKYYSSGMQSRLAFSIAIHLERRDILIADEALAAGDTAFIEKCFGKVREIVRQGQTVLFTSHQLHDILTLSSRCLYLSEGRVIQEGDPLAVTEQYRRDLTISQEAPRVSTFV